MAKSGTNNSIKPIEKSEGKNCPTFYFGFLNLSDIANIYIYAYEARLIPIVIDYTY